MGRVLAVGRFAAALRMHDGFVGDKRRCDKFVDRRFGAEMKRKAGVVMKASISTV